MGIIRAICISERRGTKKQEVLQAELKEKWGIVGDAHAGDWHRQVSLLSQEKIEAFRSKGADVAYGDFGENLVVEGFDLAALPTGTRLKIGDAVLEVTQIGKECHSHCEIYQRMGECIMPKEGIFARVLHGGCIEKGDEVECIPAEGRMPYTAAVITLSDKGYAGEREDRSGPTVRKMLLEDGYEVVETLILPDEQEMLEHELKRLADSRQVQLILTTGGTGFSKR